MLSERLWPCNAFFNAYEPVTVLQKSVRGKLAHCTGRCWVSGMRQERQGPCRLLAVPPPAPLSCFWAVLSVLRWWVMLCIVHLAFAHTGLPGLFSTHLFYFFVWNLTSSVNCLSSKSEGILPPLAFIAHHFHLWFSSTFLPYNVWSDSNVCFPH